MRASGCNRGTSIPSTTRTPHLVIAPWWDDHEFNRIGSIKGERPWAALRRRNSCPSFQRPAKTAPKAVGGRAFMGFIAAAAFSTILAVVAGLTLSGAATLSHDLWVNVVRRGHAEFFFLARKQGLMFFDLRRAAGEASRAREHPIGHFHEVLRKEALPAIDIDDALIEHEIRRGPRNRGRRNPRSAAPRKSLRSARA